MKVTLQNDRYIATAIENVTGEERTNTSWGADSEDNLIIFFPENVDISAVEAEIANVKAIMDLNELRAERDILIAKTDWWASSDLTMTDEQINYRQELRDITNTYQSLDEVVWPTPPA